MDPPVELAGLRAALGESVADAAAEGVDQVFVGMLRVGRLVEPIAAAAGAGVVLQGRLQVDAPRVDLQESLVEQQLELIQPVGDPVPRPVRRAALPEYPRELAERRRADARPGRRTPGPAGPCRPGPGRAAPGRATRSPGPPPPNTAPRRTSRRRGSPADSPARARGPGTRPPRYAARRRSRSPGAPGTDGHTRRPRRRAWPGRTPRTRRRR